MIFYLFVLHTHTQAHVLIIIQEDWQQTGTGAWLKGAEEKFLLETKALQLSAFLTYFFLKKKCEESGDLTGGSPSTSVTVYTKHVHVMFTQQTVSSLQTLGA